MSENPHSSWTVMWREMTGGKKPVPAKVKFTEHLSWEDAIAKLQSLRSSCWVWIESEQIKFAGKGKRTQSDAERVA